MTTGFEKAGVILDDAGRAWPADRGPSASQPDCTANGFDVIAHAVTHLGYVHISPLQDALMVRFNPDTVSRLAVIAAFYEIAGRAPNRLILACPTNPGNSYRYEIFSNLGQGLKRIEAATEDRNRSIIQRNAVST